MNLKTLWSLTKDSLSAWVDDYAPSMGAALAYYTMFSLAPLLIIVIAIAGMVFGAEAARGQIVDQLRGLMGVEGAAAVQGMLTSASSPTRSIVASIVGLLTLLIGATSIFGELQSDLDRIWRAPAAKTGGGLWVLVRSRLLSFGMILTIGFLLLVSLVVSAGLAALGTWGESVFGGASGVVLQVLNLVVSFAIVTVLFALIYKILPRVRVAWRDVWIGAGVTASLFTAGKFVIGLYLGKSGVTSAFGAAGSVVVLLVWVYYSAQIFLVGAEFTWVFAHRHGSLAAVVPLAAPAVISVTPVVPPATPNNRGGDHCAAAIGAVPGGAEVAGGAAGSSVARHSDAGHVDHGSHAHDRNIGLEIVEGNRVRSCSMSGYKQI
jgi:membrane protein